MRTVRLKSAGFYLFLLLIGIALSWFEYGDLMTQKGTLLVTLTFWAGLAQGAIALVAICELIGAKWIESLRQELLAVRPLLLLIAALLLLWGLRLDLYPWSTHPGRWLNPYFFLLRNLVLLLLSFVAAEKLSRFSLDRDPRSKIWAVVYLFVFVSSQSLVAFDWVMSLEYPWYSSLFGAYFFVEAIYGGIACAGLIYLLRYRKEDAALDGDKRSHLNDIGLLLFGFSVLWIGLFFTQFLLLWYGNLPEEVDYIIRRTSEQPALALCYAFLATNFLVPFCVFLYQKAKRNVLIVAVVSAIVLLGLLIEKALYIFPVVSIHSGLLVVENLLLFFSWFVSLHMRDQQALRHPNGAVP